MSVFIINVNGCYISQVFSTYEKAVEYIAKRTDIARFTIIEKLLDATL